jgi:hypothetical protein
MTNRAASPDVIKAHMCVFLHLLSSFLSGSEVGAGCARYPCKLRTKQAVSGTVLSRQRHLRALAQL